jgi:hypothetical protein
VRRAAAALLLTGAAALPALASPSRTPTPAPAATSPGRTDSGKPPLDFTGVWVLDEAASRNVSPAMKGETLNVRQTGNQIWISSMDPAKSRLLSETIVVDGRPYEKALGTKGKGLLTVAWGKDRTSLWLEMTAGPEDDPRRIVQRSVWKLSKDRKTWVRQSVTVQEGNTSESVLVLRRKTNSAPTTRPTARPTPRRTPAG